MKGILGLDTSCYTTSAAFVSTTGQILSSHRLLLQVALGARGLRQNEAVFQHIRQLPSVMDELRRDVPGMELVAVCASTAPRAGDESYMPVFSVGASTAQAIASALCVPYYQTNHQLGHLMAARYDSDFTAERYVAVHLSGGTTDLLLVEDEQVSALGSSLDLHAGQLVDRTGVLLGLPFPAGPMLEALARGAKPRAIFPVCMTPDGLSCHLSGAEAAAKRMAEGKSASREQIAAEVFDVLSRTVSRMLSAAAHRTNCRHALITGGIASSTLFRDMLTQRLGKACPSIRPSFGKPELSGDNACGVALIGCRRYQTTHVKKEE